MIMYSAIFLQPDVAKIIEENGVPTHTDYPYEPNKAGYVTRVIADVQGLDILPKEKAQFFSGNLRRFFRTHS